MSDPKRGEIWIIQFDPQIGSEIGKKRPAVVVNLDSIGKLPLRIIVPITGWDSRYSSLPWFVPIEPSETNGLSKKSGADAFQTKSLSLDRFINKVGNVTSNEIRDIVNSIALCIGVQ